MMKNLHIKESLVSQGQAIFHQKGNELELEKRHNKIESRRIQRINTIPIIH